MEPKFIPIVEEFAAERKEEPGVTPLAVFRELLRSSRQAGFFQRIDPVSGGAETILGVEPFETIRIRGLEARLEKASGQVSFLKGDPFSIVGERLKANFAEPDPHRTPFAGAALGYFAYDCVRLLEPVLCATPGNLQALSSGSVSQFDAEIYFFKKLIVFREGKINLVSGYFPSETGTEVGMLQARSDIEALREQVARSGSRLELERPLPSAEEVPAFPIEEMDSMLGHAGFIAGVAKLKAHILAGDIFQAVLSEKFSAPFEGDPLDLFRVLGELGPSPYRFYLATENGALLGASPEMLVSLRGNELETHPIAGTRRRSSDPLEERKLERQLLRSEKEKAEHLMLVDLARNDLGKVSRPGSVRVDSFMQLKKFSGVMHLVSKVTGQLAAPEGPLSSLAACFPAGTLSGAPKIRAMQLISEIETEPRGFYGGAVIAAGFSGHLDSCISIRSLEVRDGRAIVQAGAGIVADSRAESEYAEIQHKSRVARRALAVAASLARAGRAAR